MRFFHFLPIFSRPKHHLYRSYDIDKYFRRRQINFWTHLQRISLFSILVVVTFFFILGIKDLTTKIQMSEVQATVNAYWFSLANFSPQTYALVKLSEQTNNLGNGFSFIADGLTEKKFQTKNYIKSKVDRLAVGVYLRVESNRHQIILIKDNMVAGTLFVGENFSSSVNNHLARITNTTNQATNQVSDFIRLSLARIRIKTVKHFAFSPLPSLPAVVLPSLPTNLKNINLPPLALAVPSLPKLPTLKLDPILKFTTSRDQILVANQQALRSNLERGLANVGSAVNTSVVRHVLGFGPKVISDSFKNISYLNNETDKFLLATAQYSVGSVNDSLTKTKEIIGNLFLNIPSKIIGWFKSLPNLAPPTLITSIINNWHDFLFTDRSNTGEVKDSQTASIDSGDISKLKDQIRQEVINELENEMGQVFDNLRLGQPVVLSPSQNNSKEGLIVLPDNGGEDRLATKNRLTEMFSDPVDVQFDADGRSGVITPQFKSGAGDDYVFLLTPLE